MTPAQAKRRIEQSCRAASSVFLATGEFNLLFHFGKAGDEQVVMPPPGADKDEAAAAIRELLASYGAQWVVVVTEAWRAFIRVGEPLPPTLEHRPGRREVLYYQLEDHEAGALSAEQEIIREPGKMVRLAELTFVETPLASSGRLVGLLPTKGRMQ